MGKNQRGFTKQKTKMTADLIASVATAVAEDHLVSSQDLARAHGTSYGTISRILHSQLGLVKKSAKKRIKPLSHPPYSHDLAPADYFLFQLKKELAGITMTQEEFKKGWELAGRSSRRPSCTSTSGAKSLFA
jgi:hypothetical protein